MKKYIVGIILTAALTAPVRGVGAVQTAEAEGAAQTAEAVKADDAVQIAKAMEADGAAQAAEAMEAGDAAQTIEAMEADGVVQTAETVQRNDTSSSPSEMRDFIKEHHPSPFTKMTEEEFDAQIDELVRSWNDCGETERYYAMRRLVAALGDEHTMLLPPENITQPELPFFVMIYDGHWMIVQAQKEYGELVGKELTAVNGTAVSQIREKLLPLISSETQQWADVQCSQEIRYLRNLKYTGIADSLAFVEITAKDIASGEEVTTEVEASDSGYDYQNSSFYPMAQTLAQSGYYYATLLDDGSAFLQYNVCQENPRMTMREFAQKLEQQLLADAPEKVIIDLRHNSGGNSEVIRPLLKTLEKFREAGSRLYCLTGPQTFSSGVMNALDLQEIGAQLVGEPTGGVLAFGELVQKKLPDGSTLYCSTKDFSSAYGLSEQLQPEIEIVQTAEDFLAGKDTAVDYICDGIVP